MGPRDDLATRAPGVAALDRLSEQLLAAAADLRVAVAATDAEREATFRLRHDEVVARGWTRERATGLERDAHDDAGALHIGAWRRGELAGTLRLVLPAAGRLLPVEEAFGVEVEPRGAVAEAGRLVVAPAFRGDPTHRIWGALFACAWVSLREHGLAVLAGTASPAMIERLRALGLPFELLGPARLFWGETRHPVRLDPAQSHPRWY